MDLPNIVLDPQLDGTGVRTQAFLGWGMDKESEEEFVAFYVAHSPRLVAALALVLPSGEEPEDVAQEAFTRAFEHWGRLRDHPRPDGWLFLTAYRLATSLRRRAATRMKTNPPGLASRDQLEGSLVDVLRGLKPRQRAAVLLRYHYGLSTRETADALRCREGTVKSLLARARETLASSNAAEGE